MLIRSCAFSSLVGYLAPKIRSRALLWFGFVVVVTVGLIQALSRFTILVVLLYLLLLPPSSPRGVHLSIEFACVISEPAAV